jgi:hypothetical protein
MVNFREEWRGHLWQGRFASFVKLLRTHEQTGRPLGDEAFLATLEQGLGRTLRRLKPGPKEKRSPETDFACTRSA